MDASFSHADSDMNKLPIIPSIDIAPTLRQADQDPSVGESEQEFIERGLRSEVDARKSGKLHSTPAVMAALDQILEAGRKRRGP